MPIITPRPEGDAPAGAFALHALTPIFVVADPRGLTVRRVAYHRRTANESPVRHVHRVDYGVDGRHRSSWDARLWARAERGEALRANLETVADVSGRVLRGDSVDAGWRVHLHGLAGEQWMSWDGRGNRRRAQYDLSLRPLALHEAMKGDNERCVERIEYAGYSTQAAARNGCGRLERHDDPAGSRRIDAYSILGLAQAETRRFLASLDPPDWPATVAQRDASLESAAWTTRWRYAATGETRGFVDARGHDRRFVTDVAGHLQQIVLRPAGSTSDRAVVSHGTYTAADCLAAHAWGNGTVTTWTYRRSDDRLERIHTLRSADLAVLQDLSYDYDPAGNVVRVVDATRSRYETFTHDTLYRLVEASGHETPDARGGRDLPAWKPFEHDDWKDYRESYTYDEGDNLTTCRHDGAFVLTQRMAVSPTGNRSLPWDGEHAPDIDNGFDDNGNQRVLEADVLRWNARDQLDGVTAGPDDRWAERYVYGGDGMRLRKRVNSPSNVQEARYLPGLEWRDDRVAGTPLHLAQVGAEAGRAVWLQQETSTPADMPGGRLRYLLTDRLGSCTVELDDAGEPVASEWYYPFGGTAGRVARDSQDAEDRHRRYVGKERDASGLYDYGFRHYAPWLRRWIAPDPSGGIDGPNRFAMVRGNPTTFVDLFGLFSNEQIALASANAFFREGVSAAVAGSVQAGVTYGLGQLVAGSIVNPTLTALGALSGAISGGVAGLGLGADFAQRRQHGVIGHTAAAIVGLVTGAAFGAAPSVVGHFTHPGLNTDAIRQVSALVGAGVRESTAQAALNVGSSIRWSGEPPPWSAAAGNVMQAGPAAIIGATRDRLPDSLYSSVLAPFATAISAAAGTGVRSVSAHTGFHEPTGFRTPQATPTFVGAMVRGSLATTGHVLDNLASMATGAVPWPALRGAVRTMSSVLPGEWRLLTFKRVDAGIRSLARYRHG